MVSVNNVYGNVMVGVQNGMDLNDINFVFIFVNIIMLILLSVYISALVFINKSIKNYTPNNFTLKVMFVLFCWGVLVDIISLLYFNFRIF